jgi:UDP-N-acetylmuramate: L-alanyl-gamma-D-glutamyl-meso-diaminopimelate ligase
MKNRSIFACQPKEDSEIQMSITNKRIHFIAIGGGAMHQLAIALKTNQNHVTGSDDEIFEPSRSNLRNASLLPSEMGWRPELIQSDIDIVVLGMHAKADNPELLKAKELGLKVLSYPELIYEHAADKQRIVIAGSHGKTTTTAMIMHVLKFAGRKFDYLVGAQVPGFENTVQLTDEAPIMIIEGDEYYASPELSVPKFLIYKHHVGLVTGIAWDHINVFPTEHSYVRQFDHFADETPKAGILVYNDEDALTSVICKKEREDVTVLEYGTPKYAIKNGKTFLVSPSGKEIPVRFFGLHNLSNANGARTLLAKLAINDDLFYEAIQSFEPASNRLEKLGENQSLIVYRDFAHAPSKLEATTQAVRNQYPDKKLIAVMELHTFSSLNKDFIGTYANSLSSADEAIVYFNPEVVKHKKLSEISEGELKSAFSRDDLKVYTDSDSLFSYLKGFPYNNAVLLLMSSGSFNGQDIKSFSNQILQKEA